MELQTMDHLKIREALGGDGLELLLKHQRLINAHIKNLDNLKQKEKELLTKEYILALTAEAYEALDLINWKFWKKGKKEINVRELKFELIDIQHFLNCLYILWGMDRNEIVAYFMAKGQENIKRQERGY